MSAFFSDRLICRTSVDPDMFLMAYAWKDQHVRDDYGLPKTHTSLACAIHIDDIEGIFGEQVFSFAQAMTAGKWESLPTDQEET